MKLRLGVASAPRDDDVWGLTSCSSATRVPNRAATPDQLPSAKAATYLPNCPSTSSSTHTATFNLPNHSYFRPASTSQQPITLSES